MVAEAVQNNNLSWEQSIAFEESDFVGGSGILQDTIQIGDEFTALALMRHSIIYSDNIAHRMLTRLFLPQAVPLTMDLTNAVFERYLPTAIATARLAMTPNQLTEIFKVLYQNQALIPGYQTILNYMKTTAWNDRFKTALTTGHIAHAPGWTAPYSHDSGIFFTANPYILVVFTEDVFDASTFLSEIANLVFELVAPYESLQQQF